MTNTRSSETENKNAQNTSTPSRISAKNTNMMAIITIFKTIIKMAKEQKKVETNVALSMENVVDNIRKDNTLQRKNIDAAIEKIAQQKDEKQQKEAMDAMLRADYNVKKSLLQLRARRGEEKATKEALTRNSALLNRLTGRDGEGKEIPADQVITPNEYAKLLDESAAKTKEDIKKVNEELEKHMRELRDSFEGQYCYWW